MTYFPLPYRPFLPFTRFTKVAGLHAAIVDGRPILVLVATVEQSDEIRCNDARDGSEISRIEVGHFSRNSTGLRSAALSCDDGLMLVGGFPYSAAVRQWSLPTGELTAEWRAPAPWDAVCLHRLQGTTVAAVAVAHRVWQLDAATGREAGPRLRTDGRRSWWRRGEPVKLTSLVVMGPYLLGGDRAGDLWCWERESGVLVEVRRGVHRGPIRDVVAWQIGDRTVVATTGGDTSVRFTELESGRSWKAVGLWPGLGVEAVAPGGTAGELLVCEYLVATRFDAATGGRLSEVARWEPSDPDATRDDDYEYELILEAACTLRCGDDEWLFVATSAGIFRIDVKTAG
jgi:hypothetical protein